MKKIISFLLLAAMLVGCFSSAVLVSASDATFAVESVEKTEGTGTTVASKVTIANNAGTSFLKLVVFYNASELALADTDNAFANSIFSEADSDVSKQYAGTNKNVKPFIPADLQATSNGFVVELVGADEEEVVGDGIAIELPFEIIAEAVGTYNFTVVVADEDDNVLDTIDATVNYVADPLIGIYDEFTVFTDPGDTQVTVGTTEISVDVRFDNNPGLWSSRFFIVHPAALSLNDGSGMANIENTFRVFQGEGEMFLGYADVPVKSETLQEAWLKYIAANPDAVKDGYCVSIVYFEATGFETNYSGNGVVCTLNFTIDSSVKAGDVLDITIHQAEDADYIWASTDADGTPIFTKYWPTIIGSNLTIVDKVCEHTNTAPDHKDATCGEDGYDKVVCSDCGATISETVIEATGAHTEGTPEVTGSTCTVAGKEVYNCTVCGQFIRQEDLGLAEHERADSALCKDSTCKVCGTEMPATAEHITLQPGNTTTQNPTCTEDGYVKRVCDVCGEQTSYETLPAYGHDEDGKVETTPATCITEGSIITYCDFCGEVSKVETIPVTTTHNLVYVEATEAACHQTGNVEYWYCKDCDAVYTDAEGEHLSNRKNVIIPALNELAYVPAAEACHAEGTQEYWFCPECETVFADAAATIVTNRKNLTILPDCELIHMDAVEPCHANGTYEYWFCPECEAVFADAAGTQLTNRMNLTIPADAEAKHVAKVEATCTTNGMAEYWYCEECDTFFADAECKYNVAYLSLTIPATGHDFTNGDCACGEKAPATDDDKKPENDKAPVTGDNIMFIVIALAVVLVAGAAIVLFRRKRSAN